MGIGKARDLPQALGYCIKAGLDGYIPAILTAISLFDVYQQSTLAQSAFQLTEKIAGLTRLDLEATIQKWKNGNWNDESIDSPNVIDAMRGCRASLPIAFTQTSAARVVSRNYPNIRTKICATM